MTSINNAESGSSVRTKLNNLFTSTESFFGITAGDTSENGSLNLNAIAETKAVTVVDVFVYDTSKDSDGGAWRNRTQGTSWYNETLNTSTRGSRREFPAVAVIVAESNKVTIYDGDDPSLPMWRVTNRVGGQTGFWRNVSGFDATSTTAENGKVVFTIKFSTFSNASAGVAVADFAADTLTRYSTLNGGGTGLTVSQDATAGINFPTIFSSGDPLIVNAAINDVAMTVLPDAPIDPATGLPVPTIAVATDGGVSVIRDDGTVVDSVTTNSSLVHFNDEGLFYINEFGNILILSSYEDIAAGDGFGTPIANTSGSNDFAMLCDTTSSDFLAEDFIAIGGTTTTNLAVPGLMLHQPNYSDQTKGMSALLTSTYNTGWMNGDIKGAFLSDTDDTDLVGSGELVTNGTFDTDTNWTKQGSLTAISGGTAVIGDATQNGSMYQNVGLVTGKNYILSYDLVSKPSSSVVFLVNNTSQSTANGVLLHGTGVSAYTTYTVNFVATGPNLNFIVGGGNTSATIDNVSVKLADADRSVNG